MTWLTIYAPFDSWLVRLAEGWRLCGMAPEPIHGWSVLMSKPEPRVAYKGFERYDHR